MTDDLVKRPDDEQDDLTLVYMWAYRMAEKKYKSRIEQLEAALREICSIPAQKRGSASHAMLVIAAAALGEKTDG
jgi:hypothetical protein